MKATLDLHGTTAALVDFSAGLKFADIPAATVAAARMFLLDTLTVAVAGSSTPEAAAVVGVSKDWGNGRGVPVIGAGGLKLPPGQAAFVNAFQTHVLEWDCVHEAAVVHAMSVPMNALLTVAAADSRITTREFLAALVVAVDVAVNLGVATRSALRFFRPATAGLMGASLGLARLKHFEPKMMADCLGLAYSQVAGTMQAHVEGSIALPIQVAVAARSAVTAFELAGAGLGGPHDVIEGPFGYFKLIETEFDLGIITERLGRNWGIAELSHKPFPTGRAAHAILDGINQLQAAAGFGPDDIKEITARVPPLIERLAARRPKPDMTPSHARLCVPYLAASQLIRATLGPESYRPEQLKDAHVLALAERIHVISDGTSDPNAMSPQSLEIILKDGRKLTLTIPHTLGSPQNPLTGAQRTAKALACLRPRFGAASENILKRLEAAVNEGDDQPAGNLLNLLSEA